jgi:hypothetical protein
MKKYLVVLAMLAVFSVAANAEIWWAGGTGDFGTGANWGGSVPGPGQAAGININGMPQPTLSSGSYAMQDVLIGDWAAGSMTQTGGSLTLSGTFIVGYEGASWGYNAPHSQALFTMSGGTLQSQWAWIGFHLSMDPGWDRYPIDGTANISGGSIDIQQWLQVGGHSDSLMNPQPVGKLNISGGQVDVGFGMTIVAGSDINLQGGTLKMWNKGFDYASIDDIQALIDQGKIIGNGIQITTFDNGMGDDSQGYLLTSVPEPVTMVLLGLGGLGLIRRRK